jgi:DNA-binding MarR family transcriptional regulator
MRLIADVEGYHRQRSMPRESPEPMRHPSALAADPSALTAELMAEIERIRRLSNRLSRLLQDDHGVSVYQVGILAAIADGARHLNDVADATGQQASGASRLVERLARDGLLERGPDPRDRRAIVLDLTPRGERLLADARELVGRTILQALDHMPAEHARQLLPVMGSFLDAAQAVLAGIEVHAHVPSPREDR